MPYVPNAKRPAKKPLRGSPVPTAPNEQEVPRDPWMPAPRKPKTPAKPPYQNPIKNPIKRPM
jgi:hypothetical protein